MSMELTLSVRTCIYDMYLFIFFLHLVSTQSTCPKVSTFSLKLGQYCPTHPPDNKGENVLQMPQQVSIFSYISPGSSLGKSMTSERVYNIPLMSMHFTSTLSRVQITMKIVQYFLLELRYTSVVLPQRYGEVELQNSEDPVVYRLRGLVSNFGEKQTRE